MKSSSSLRSLKCCLFCQQNSHSLDKCSHFRLRMHKDKINFVKENGVCFGCLKVGHTSKDCRSHLDRSECHQKHPSVLHIQKKDTGTSFKEAQEECFMWIVSDVVISGPVRRTMLSSPLLQFRWKVRWVIKLCRHMHIWIREVRHIQHWQFGKKAGPKRQTIQYFIEDNGPKED